MPISPCTIALPTAASFDDCNRSVADSGFNYLILSTPDVSFDPNVNPITDPASWQAFIDAGKIALSPILAEGEQPEPDVTLVRTSACATEQARNKTHTWQGYSNRIDKSNRSEWNFWNDLEKKKTGYFVGVVGCDGYLRLDYRGDTEVSYPGYFVGGNGIAHLQSTNQEADEQRYTFNFTFRLSELVPLLKVDNFVSLFEASVS